MTNCLKQLFILLLFCTLSFSIWAQEGWELAKEKEGIRVYTRPVKDSQFKAYQGITETETTVSALVALLQDIDSYPQWMPNNELTEVLHKSGDTELIYYMAVDAPWPVQDRDGVYQVRFESRPNTPTIMIRVEAVPDYLPEKEGYERIRRMSAYWRLHPNGDGSVHITYEAETEPGGNIPAWLANSAVVSQPFKTLKALKERVKLPKYQGREFSFLK